MLADEQAALGQLVETLADNDDVLLEKVLEDIKPTPEELYRDMRKDLLAGAVIEVLARCRRTRQRRAPPVEGAAPRHADPAETAERRGIVPDGAPRAQVFKTVYAGHTGKLSYARVWSGTIADGAQLGGTRLGGIYRFVNGELTKVPEADKATSSHSAAWTACRPAPPCRPAGNPNPCPSRGPARRSTRWRSPPPIERTM